MMVCIYCGKMDIQSNIWMEIEGYRSIDNEYVTYVRMILGIYNNDRKTGVYVPMILDTTFDDIYVLDDNNDGKTGSICTSNNMCSTNYTKEYKCVYKDGYSNTCYVSHSYMRFIQSDIDYTSIDMIDFKLVNTSDGWVNRYGRNGVIGINRNSNIWMYIYKAYDNHIYDISMYYKIDDYSRVLDTAHTDIHDSLWIINGRYEMNEPIRQQYIVSDAYDTWIYHNMDISISNTYTVNGVRSCIDNTVNSYVMIPDAKTTVSNILYTLCGNRDVCYMNNSHMNRLTDIVITYNGYRHDDVDKDSVNIRPDEYINYLDSGTVVVGISDISSSYACSKDIDNKYADIGLGRLFFSKVEFIIRYNTTNINDTNTIFSLGFNKIIYPNNTIFIIVLIILSIVIVILFICILIARYSNRSLHHDDK